MKYRASVQLLIDTQAPDETAAKEEILRQLGEGGIGGDDIVCLEVAELHDRQFKGRLSREGGRSGE